MAKLLSASPSAGATPAAKAVPNSTDTYPPSAPKPAAGGGGTK